MPGAVALADGAEALASAAPELAGGWGSMWAGATARPAQQRGRARGAGRASLGVLLRRLRRELDPIPEHSQVSFCAPPVAPAPRAFNNSWRSSPIVEEADVRRGARHRRMAAVQQATLHLEDARRLEAGGAQDTVEELLHMFFLVLVVLLTTGCAACSFHDVQLAVVK